MIKQKRIVTLNDYIALFSKTFHNFCSKNILELGYEINHDTLTLTDYSGLMTKPLVYQLTPSTTVKTAVHEIAEGLEEFYPTIYRTETKSFSASEVKDLLNNHTPEEIEAMENEVEEIPYYTFFRVINDANEIHAFPHFGSDKVHVFKFFTPVMNFVDFLYTDIEKAGIMFSEKAHRIK